MHAPSAGPRFLPCYPNIAPANDRRSLVRDCVGRAWKRSAVRVRPSAVGEPTPTRGFNRHRAHVLPDVGHGSPRRDRDDRGSRACRGDGDTRRRSRHHDAARRGAPRAWLVERRTVDRCVDLVAARHHARDPRSGCRRSPRDRSRCTSAVVRRAARARTTGTPHRPPPRPRDSRPAGDRSPTRVRAPFLHAQQRQRARLTVAAVSCRAMVGHVRWSLATTRVA